MPRRSRGPRKGSRGVGDRGESHAAAVLERAGWRVLERNFQARRGELDLVVEKDGELGFVEVKSRRSASLGPPEISVTLAKQRRIAQLALLWAAARGRQDAAMHFHVVAVDLASDGSARSVRFIPDAFAPGDFMR